VTRAIDVGIVSVVGRVFDVCGGNCDTTLALFRSLVDGSILEIASIALFGLTLGDGSSQGSLTVIDVTDGT